MEYFPGGGFNAINIQAASINWTLFQLSFESVDEILMCDVLSIEKYFHMVLFSFQYCAKHSLK